MFVTPRWIVSHLFVLALLIGCTVAGFWQIDRLDARQAENARIEARLGRLVRLESLDVDATEARPAAAEYTRVELTGRYDPDRARDILVANRVADGAPGFWMWSVLDLDGGSEIIVNRGFVSRRIVVGTEGSPSLEQAAPPPGPVMIEGILRRGIEGGALSSDGSQISRPDSAHVATDRGVATVLDPELYVEVQRHDPVDSSLVTPVPPPDLGEGPHRSYAFQWFTFAVLGTIGYGLVLRRIARGDAARGDVPF